MHRERGLHSDVNGWLAILEADRARWPAMFQRPTKAEDDATRYVKYMETVPASSLDEETLLSSPLLTLYECLVCGMKSTYLLPPFGCNERL